MIKKSKKLYKKTGYISLREAAKYCPYSQEYLSLRARQGKLKAVKIGRNWVTTKEWVEDYLRRFNNVGKKEIEPEKISLYQGLPESYSFEESEEKKVIKHLLFLGITTVILSISLIFLAAFSRNTYDVNSYALEGDINIISEETFSSLTFSDLKCSLIKNFKDYKDWLKKKVSDVFVVLNHKYIGLKERFSSLSLRSLFKKRIPSETVKISETAVQEEMGVVIFPHSLEAKAKEQIANAFSDKVKIEPQDENSGIIVPIFKSKEEQKYFYIMVPVKEQ
ncbi:helix-turn-helix domain-containing protein [bacterium]|nr:helix-turn-helix domain-containing protein [bacterium]